jgi:predicted nucleic acid-binding Zn ribbon protein
MAIKKKTLYRYQCDQCGTKYPETDSLDEAQVDQREHESSGHQAGRGDYSSDT